MLIKILAFLVTEMVQGSPSWGGMFAFFVPLAPFGPSPPPKLNCKKRCIRVYYCYRGGGFYECNYVSDTIWMTSLGMGDFLDVSDMILTAFFHVLALFFIFS